MKVFGVLAAAGLLAGSLSAVASAARPGEQEERGRVATGDVRFLGPGGGRLGVQVKEVDADEARNLGLDRPRGARVVEVDEDSPASKAGLKKDDIILELDGEPVRGVAELVRLVRETPPGREVAVVVQRSGQRQSLSAVIEEGGIRGLFEGIRIPEMRDLPQVPRFDFDGPHPGEAPMFAWRFDGGPRLGLRFQEISGQLARYFGLKDERGLLVVHVDEDTPAARAGVMAGDVLLELAGRTLEDGEDLRRAVRELDDDAPSPLRVLRRGEDKSLEVTPEPRRARPPRQGGEAL